jgi:hypothetical protein
VAHQESGKVPDIQCSTVSSTVSRLPAEGKG